MESEVCLYSWCTGINPSHSRNIEDQGGNKHPCPDVRLGLQKADIVDTDPSKTYMAVHRGRLYEHLMRSRTF